MDGEREPDEKMFGTVCDSIGVGVSGPKADSIVEGILAVFWLPGESALGGEDANDGRTGPDANRKGGA